MPETWQGFQETPDRVDRLVRKTDTTQIDYTTTCQNLI